jgi:hypothetical protein
MRQYKILNDSLFRLLKLLKITVYYYWVLDFGFLWEMKEENIFRVPIIDTLFLIIYNRTNIFQYFKKSEIFQVKYFKFRTLPRTNHGIRTSGDPPRFHVLPGETSRRRWPSVRIIFYPFGPGSMVDFVAIGKYK